MTCDHMKWVYPEPVLDDYAYGEVWIHPEPYQVSTTEDIDVGRYKCTQCGHVMYYTGLWREHWEGGRKLLDERTGNVKPKCGDQQLHTYGPAICEDCGHRWMAVWPLAADALECPKCHSKNTDREQSVLGKTK